MEYKFKSLFNRSNEYTIETDEPLHLYDSFALSIKKVDNDIKSFSYENIVCILKCSKYNELGTKVIELDRYNFSGFYTLVEVYKNRNCLSMGEPLELIKEEIPYEYKETNLNNADTELKADFNRFITENNVMEVLFQCFLKGVSFGKKL